MNAISRQRPDDIVAEPKLPQGLTCLPQLGISGALDQSFQPVLKRPFVGRHHTRINETAFLKLQPFPKTHHIGM